jgi:hypothetical protein
MAGSARVDSIDALLKLKVALVRFSESVSAALMSAEGDMQRTLQWLEQDQQLYWKGQMRLWHERVQTAMSKLSDKRLFKNVDGSTPSTVEEERALHLARQRYGEAEEKLRNVKRWIPRFRKEIDQFRAGVNRLRMAMSIDIPLGQARLERMAVLLQQYVDLTVERGQLTEVWQQAVQSVARAAPALVEEQPAKPPEAPQ